MSDKSTNDAQGPGDSGSERRAMIVSAYVDGEATPDEARQVESDADLSADVARLRALKRDVGDVPRLAPEHRDHLLAGALAQFDDQHGTAPPRASRPGGSRWLAVAAAAVAVVATAGIAVSLLATSGSDDSGPAANEAVESPTDAEQDSPTPADESGDDTADEGELADTASAPEAGDAPPTEEETAVEPEGTDAGGAPTARTSNDGEEELADDEAMVDWVRRVQDGELSPDGQGDTVCERAVLGTATHRSAVVVVAFEDDLVVARDAKTCDEVLSADAP